MPETKQETSNPLLEKFTTPHGVPPFHLITEDHYEEAMEKAIALARANIQAIVDNPETPNFKNTMEALESSSEDYERVSGVFGNLEGLLSTDRMQELSEKFAVLSTEFSNEVTFNEALFARVKHVFDNQDKENLTPEQKTLLKKSYDSFVRSGALLPADKKEQLKKLFVQLSELNTRFENNTINEMKEVFLVVDAEEDLKGIPQTTIENARKEAKDKGLDGKFILKATSSVAVNVMSFAENRVLRQKYWKMRSTLCQSGKNDNTQTLKDILSVRHQIAGLLGYKNHAEKVLKDRMAKTPEAVFEMIETIKKGALPKAKKELAELQEFALRTDGIKKLEPWDSGFYAEKLQKEKFGFDANDLKSYYPLPNVLEGVFNHFERIYGLSFQENKSYPKYHEDVMAFDLFDKKTGAFMGVFYADFFARDGKRSGAWANFYREGGLFEGQKQCPVATIACNFERAFFGGPSLLSHDDVVTIFHEMGHAMHLMTYKGNYRGLSGFNVKWDYVELPSQLMEKWAEEKELLNTFARHCSTGELMPDSLIQGLKESSLFLNGMRWTRQSMLGNLDMQYHTCDPQSINDILAFEQEQNKEFALFPYYGGGISTTFTHIFSGGYSAGYYSYAWADVLVADAYEHLTERTLYDEERGLAFRELVLAIGAGLDEMEAYKMFRGQEPDKMALLRQEELIVNDDTPKKIKKPSPSLESKP